MADTFTTNLRLRKPQVNANNNAWGPLLNEMIADLDAAIAGTYSASVTAGNVVLTSNNGTDDQARRMVIVATGAQSVTTRTITVPDTNKLYVFVNDSAQLVTFQRSSGGTTLPVFPGDICMAFVTSAGIFETPALGSVVQNALALSSLTLDIGGTHGAGDMTTPMKYVVMGGWAFVKITTFNAQNFSSTAFTLDRTGGVDWPAELVPAKSSAILVNVLENATNLPAYIRPSTAAATAWTIEKADGSAWLGTGTDDRLMQNIGFTYPLKGP